MELEYIFVYGVFREAFHDLLKDPIFCDRAFVYGKIYQVSEFYPGYIRDSSNNKVFGDVYLINPEILPELDKFEDEYTRKKIWTSIGEECWIYEWNYPIDKFNEIIGGDWLLRGLN